MSQKINALMERASQALGKMDYLACERDCLAALSQAKAANQWSLYARILLPLQECRRQRRMIAADGWVRLGCGSAEEALKIIRENGPGCLVLTHPITTAQAQDLMHDLGQRSIYLELLYADNHLQENRWVLRSLDGPEVSVTMDAPPREWRDRQLGENESWPASAIVETARKGITPRPSDWFIDATERLGDAALASVTAPTGSPQRVEQLEACLRSVVDHEILHQQLAAAARALVKASA